MTAYADAVEESVLAVFSTASARQQRHLLNSFRQIAAAPFRASDYEVEDSSGRILAVVLRDDWLVTYWCDHAVKRVMIAEIVVVDGS